MENNKYTLDDLIRHVIQTPSSRLYPDLLIHRLLKLEESAPTNDGNRQRNKVLILYSEIIKDRKELTSDSLNQIRVIKLFSKIADAVHYNRILKLYVGSNTENDGILKNLVRLKNRTYGQALSFWEQLFLEVDSKFYVKCHEVLSNIHNSMMETSKPEVTLGPTYIIKEHTISEEETRKSFGELVDMVNDILFHKFNPEQLEYIKKADFGY